VYIQVLGIVFGVLWRAEESYVLDYRVINHEIEPDQSILEE